MKKKQIKNYLKTGILLLGISLLLWNCEKETNPIIENQSTETDILISQDDITVESLSFEIFKEFSLYNQLDNYVKFNSKSRTSQKKEHKFKIHKNTFKKITKKDIDYTSYTFLISDTENFDYAIVKNLVINQYKKNIEVFIFTYNNFILTNEHNYSINENVNIEQIFDFDISQLGDLASKDIIKQDGNPNPDTGNDTGGGGAYCYNVSIIINYPCVMNHNSVSGTHYNPSDCGCTGTQCNPPYSQYISDSFCTSDSSSSTAATNYTPSSNLTGGGTATTTVDSNDNIIVSSIIENEIPDGADPLAFLLGLDSLSSEYNWLVNIATDEQYNQIALFTEENGFSTEAQNFAKEMIDALILNIPVIFDIEKNNIYQGNPLNFNTLTPEQKVAVLVYAVKKVVSDNTLDYVDIRQLFYNLPTVSVHIIAKIPVNGKLLDVGFILGTAYNNLQINPYPNDGRQYGPLVNRIGNYIMDGYWWTLKYRTYNPSQSNSAEALFIQVKQKSQYDYENGYYFENFLGY